MPNFFLLTETGLSLCLFPTQNHLNADFLRDLRQTVRPVACPHLSFQQFTKVQQEINKSLSVHKAIERSSIYPV